MQYSGKWILWLIRFWGLAIFVDVQLTINGNKPWTENWDQIQKKKQERKTCNGPETNTQVIANDSYRQTDTKFPFSWLTFYRGFIVYFGFWHTRNLWSRVWLFYNLIVDFFCCSFFFSFYFHTYNLYRW